MVHAAAMSTSSVRAEVESFPWYHTMPNLVLRRGALHVSVAARPR